MPQRVREVVTTQRFCTVGTILQPKLPNFQKVERAVPRLKGMHKTAIRISLTANDTMNILMMLRFAFFHKNTNKTVPFPKTAKNIVVTYMTTKVVFDAAEIISISGMGRTILSWTVSLVYSWHVLTTSCLLSGSLGSIMALHNSVTKSHTSRGRDDIFPSDAGYIILFSNRSTLYLKKLLIKSHRVLGQHRAFRCYVQQAS